MSSKFAVPVATLDRLMNYLGTQPFVEVAPLINEIQKEATLIEPPQEPKLPPAPDSDE